MHQRRIRLQAEHAAFPLWEETAHRPLTDVDPRTLGLRDTTVAALLNWNDRYAQLALLGARAQRRAEWDAWSEEGSRLARALRTELGRDVTLLVDL